ncbi:hypothetical protein BOTBODRAFT_29524 [Botryobasidium botryosum FD-172 SS1]|uniref:Diphthamide biosynthesis protein 4 n=1 Tax=Botryobasidium botryosum (strain FD-172 SS1) TaxID=930990 RepID=A0A067MR18_BOTB1|nr:hypothetical protein BOTBODRAFT_29524 [Botryobasidium botryosum FD-172 SS1]
MSPASPDNYYSLLSIAPSATDTEIKRAYRRALLLHHPDKATSTSTISDQTSSIIYTLKEAYTPASTRRPAQVVSIEEFDEAEGVDGEWVYPCRCGSLYRIHEEQMENDVHLIGCEGCSEVIWAGYEVEQQDDRDSGCNSGDSINRT